MTSRELGLRAEIMRSVAATGAPPAIDDRGTLAALADVHVVVLGEDGAIHMAHPFAAHRARDWWADIGYT